ncbi:MAG TPA: hypothetical protein VLJ84_04105 [Usitatibacter sp.]|nr:hypothetical protein [Usitatibacter sp.]
MGSIIEVFPRGGRRGLSWRSVPLPGTGRVRVRQARLDDYAALLVWLNPAYSPTEPPADLEAVRPRKCA